jgi:hypothetical protein
MSLDTISMDKLPLKENVAYMNVSWLFNYPVLIIIASILLVVAAIVWFVFGKKIRKYFRAKRMIKAHQKFLETYTIRLTELKNTQSTPAIESTLSLWKKYMEQLEAKP